MNYKILQEQLAKIESQINASSAETSDEDVYGMYVMRTMILNAIDDLMVDNA